MRLVYCSVALAVLAAAWPTGSVAQDAYDACAAIADDAARLRCFDETHAAQKAATASRAAEESARREAEFGLTATQRERRAENEAEQARVAGADAPEAAAQAEEEAVRSAVAEVFTDASRRPVILLENGQVWRGTSNSNFRRRVRAGWEAEVTRSWTGGYRMTFDGQSGFLGVARVR